MNEPSKYDWNREKEPKPKGISDDQHEKPSKKRAKVTGSSEGTFEKLIAEKVEEFLKLKKIDESIRNIHKATLDISDYTIQEVGKLEKKILKIEMENLEQEQKTGQHEERVEKLQKEEFLKICDLEDALLKLENSTKKFIEEEVQQKMTNQKLALEKMMTEWKQKMEENLKDNCQLDDVGKLQEKIQKLQEDNLQKDMENRELREKLQNSENSMKKLIEDFRKEMHEKMTKQEAEIKKWKYYQSCEDKNSLRKLIEEEVLVKTTNQELALEKMKTENLEWKKKMEENLKANYQRAIIPSDNCNLPMTAAEQEYLNKCIFCKSEEHKSMECKNVRTGIERRRAMFSEQNRCLRCLDVLDYPTKDSQEYLNNHLFSLDGHSCPRANVMCSDCNWNTRVASSAQMTLQAIHFFHHPVLCDMNDQKWDVEVRRHANNERRQFQGLPPRFFI